jgi:two-component system sensor histidine kinase/response regulator
MSEVSITSGPEAPAPALQVLVVEEVPMYQRLALGLLSKQGYTAVAADGGEEAVALVERQPFDLVLVQIQMTGIDGFEAASRIRTKAPSVPIIGMTSDPALQEECLRRGMHGYVSRPVRGEELQCLAEDVRVLDLPRALAYLRGDLEFFRHLASVFLEAYPPWCERIGEAVNNSDAETVRSVAHMIKGSLGTLGAEAAYEVALGLERAGRERDLARVRELYYALMGEIGRLKRRLAAISPERPK